jgi:hypothetical protein
MSEREERKMQARETDRRERRGRKKTKTDGWA